MILPRLSLPSVAFRSGKHGLVSVRARFEEHSAVGQHMRHDGDKAQSTAPWDSTCVRPSGKHCRVSVSARSTVPWDSIGVMIVPRLSLNDLPRTVYGLPASTAWTASARGSRSTVPWNSICLMTSPRLSWPSAAFRSGKHCMVRVSARFEEHSAVGQHMRQDCSKAPLEGPSLHRLRPPGVHGMDSASARFKGHGAAGQHMRHDLAKAQLAVCGLPVW